MMREPASYAGYVRVSRKLQAEGYSPEIQRRAIEEAARRAGVSLAMLEEDQESGTKVTRKGYQRIVQAVGEGRIHGIIVYMFDRWGRDGAEWLARANEFDRLGVEMISVLEGKDEGGLIRFVRAGMAQEESQKIARRVRPAREEGARRGTHQGRTPFGYRRLFPELDGKGRRPAGQLVPDPATAWIVREIFERYAHGGWSFRRLAEWLNSDERVPPAPGGSSKGGLWTSATVGIVLRNPTYLGKVRHNHHRTGRWERSAPGSEFIVDGKHEALVDAETFRRAEQRRSAARKAPLANVPRKYFALARGLLRCHECGSLMVPHNRRPDARESPLYVCSRHKHNGLCPAAGYGLDVAHRALVAEVRRLRGTPWTDQRAERLTGESGAAHVAHAAEIHRELEAARERLRTYARRIADMADDPTPEERAAFNEVRNEMSARIRSLETQQAALEERTAALPNLRTLHARFITTPVAAVVDKLLANGDEESLRALICELVESARLVERWPDRRSKWVRLEVTWNPDVRLLLEAELLVPDPPAACPIAEPTKRQLQCRASSQRYYWKKKQLREAQKRTAEATAALIAV